MVRNAMDDHHRQRLKILQPRRGRDRRLDHDHHHCQSHLDPTPVDLAEMVGRRT
jgi:hypothetical protein